MSDIQSTNADPNAMRSEYRRRTLHSLSMLLIWGLGLAAFALVCATTTEIVAALGIGFLIAAAAFASGALFGFLFGVPRVLARDTSGGGSLGSAPAPAGSATTGAANSATSAAARQRLIASNTNLERISDWLSTMLVGITLSQLGNINNLLLSFADMIRQRATVFTHGGKGPPDAGALPLVCTVVMVLGLVCGFLFMYLNTRLILTRLFADSEDDTFEPLSQPLATIVRAAQASVLPPNNIIAQRFAQSKTLTVSDGIGAMYDALYSQPDGYKTTIALAGTLSTTSAVSLPDYWFNLACAFGQAHADPANQSDLQSNRDNCLDAVRRTLAIDPSYRSRFVQLLGTNSLDKDLETLAGDDKLQALLGV